MNSLDLRFSKSILIKLYKEGNSLKTNLQGIVKNLYSLDKLLLALSEDGLISIDTKAFGKNIQEIGLTPKGCIVADNLTHLEEYRVKIPDGVMTEMQMIIKKDRSHSSVEEYINDVVRQAVEKWYKQHAMD